VDTRRTDDSDCSTNSLAIMCPEFERIAGTRTGVGPVALVEVTTVEACGTNPDPLLRNEGELARLCHDDLCGQSTSTLYVRASGNAGSLRKVARL
jgi:hypothetical protein